MNNSDYGDANDGDDSGGVTVMPRCPSLLLIARLRAHRLLLGFFQPFPEVHFQALRAKTVHELWVTNHTNSICKWES